MDSNDALVEAMAQEQFERDLDGVPGEWVTAHPLVHAGYRADAARMLQIVRDHDRGEVDAAIRGYQHLLDEIQRATGTVADNGHGDEVPTDFRSLVAIVADMRDRLTLETEAHRRLITAVQRDLLEWAQDCAAAAPYPAMDVTTDQVAGVYSAVVNRARGVLPGTTATST